MVLGFDDAIATVLEHAALGRLTEVERVELPAARSRVLGEAVTADRDQPPFHRSTRDGFAVRAPDMQAERTLQVRGLIRAGEEWTGAPLETGGTLEIMTGAPLPPGADAVVMVEHVERFGDTVCVQPERRVRAGENVVPRGAEAREGDVLLPAGTLIGAAEIAMAAACGRASLTVYRRPTVAIVATGDELVELNETMAQHQIRNSNSYGLAALVEATGGAPIRQPIARDEPGAILRAIQAARESDLLVLSGGVSMGKYDLVEAALAELGAEFLFTGVKMQPGRPVIFGRLPETIDRPMQYFFGLPGNPVSTQVTFQAFVAPLLRALSGCGASEPPFVLARLGEEIAAKTGLTRLLPGLMTGVQVRLVGWHGSGDLAANARANCYVMLPDGGSFAEGESVRVLLR